MSRIGYYEEQLMNAWPTLQTLVLDGWIVRYGKGYSKRANSVQPLHWTGGRELEESVLGCEDIYRRLGLPAIFKITDASEPQELDSFLAQRGYKLEDLVSVQVAALDDLPEPLHPEAIFYSELTEPWLDDFCRMNPSHARHRATIRELFGQHLLACRFASLQLDGRTVACGVSVVQGASVGLFDIVTDPGYRRQGLGEALLVHLLREAKRQGAKEAYLQVLADNTAARRLYSKLGFREEYKQWFRVKAL